MQYTQVKKANLKIHQDMEFIIKEIKERIPSTISIILTGGFARGEGPVKIIKNKIIPYNDYDIQIIAKKKISKQKTDQIATEISEKLGYGQITKIFYPFKKENQRLLQSFYIDLKCDTQKELTKLLPRIRTYELKNNSKIIWGKDPRSLIPNYILKKIPLAESAKLLLDRLSQMMEYYSTEKKHDKEILTYFIQQTYAACCTSLLQISGKYQIGYLTASNILTKTYKKDFPELYEKIPNLHQKIEQFIKWKTNPKKLPNQNVEEEWFIAKRNILEVSKYFFSKFLEQNISNEQQLTRAILNMKKQFYSSYIETIIQQKFKLKILTKILNTPAEIIVPYILKRKYNQRLKQLGIKFKTKQKSPELTIFASVILLASSINEKNEIDKKRLKMAQILLQKVYPSRGKSWEEISTDYANAYITFFLQKI